MELIEKFRAPNTWKNQSIYLGRRGYPSGEYYIYIFPTYKNPALLDGWVWNVDGKRLWFIQGEQVSILKFIDYVFEQLSDQEKDEIIWNLDQWK